MLLRVEDVARQPRPGMAIPARIAFSPDGRVVTFLDRHDGSDALVRVLWQLDVATGERLVRLGLADVGGGETDANVSRAEVLRRERERLLATGITHYEWAEEAPVLLAPVRGDLFVSRQRQEVALRVARGATEAHLSADGSTVVFVRDAELHAVSAEGGEERRLTFDAAPGVSTGVAEYIAQEEMGRRDGFWIAPDGLRVAFTQVDERDVPRLGIPHLVGPPGDEEEHRYPFAGAANARVRLGIVSTGGGAPPGWLDLGETEYLARVNWRRDGQLLVQLQSRDQRCLEVRAFDVARGSSRTLLVERSDSWINLHDDLRALEGRRWLWASERTGYKHLYLYEDDRLIGQLTDGEWMVDAVLAATEREVFFSATREGPLERHVYRVPLDGGEPERLTNEPGWHDVVVARDGSMLVDTFQSRAAPPKVTLTRRAATAAWQGAIHLPSVAAAAYPPPDLFSLRSRDGETLYASVYRPAIVPAPLIVAVYGGPHAQMVQDTWAQSVDLRAQLLASRGFAVLKLDNRGSARRGHGFERHIHRALGSREVDDQVDGVRHLVAEGIADSARVGVYGWSYGGYMSLMCLARAPEVFRAGVAGAPVTEWQGYDTHYTERYMGLPAENAEGYRQASVLTHLPNIRAHLLVVHGMIDENVHFRHTARLIDALVKAGTPHELLIFPDERHLPRSERDRASLEQRLLTFFETHLQ